jgi:hypothetical protein
MTTIQAVVFGIMLALTPSIVVLAFLLWREGIGIAEGDEARSRDLYSSQVAHIEPLSQPGHFPK